MVFNESTVDKLKSLHTRAVWLFKQGRFTEAIAPAQELFNQLWWLANHGVMPRDNAWLALALNNLASLYREIGRYEAAEPLYREALDIRRRTVGEQHPDYATSLDDLASLYHYMGDYKAAEPLYREALDIRRRTVGEQHLSFILSLHNLASLYEEIGNYRAAEPLLRQALNMNKETSSEGYHIYTMSLSLLASLYETMGNYKEAKSLYQQALDIRRRTVGEQHPDYAASLLDLSLFYQIEGNDPELERVLRQVLEIQRTTLGEQHHKYTLTLNRLAWLYSHKGDDKAAESLYRQSLELQRATHGELHLSYASTLNSLGTLHIKMGHHTVSEQLYQQALDIRRRTVGEQHPDYAEGLILLAALLAMTEYRTAEAFDMMVQAASIYDRVTEQIFSIGSENQRMAYLQNIQHTEDVLLSLVSLRCPTSCSAVRKAMDLVLRRKAIGAEALAAQRDAVFRGKYPRLRQQLHQLWTLTSQLARTMLAGPGTDNVVMHQKRLRELNSEREQLEADLARQIPEMGLEQRLKRADHNGVAEALSEGTVLVEFVRFHAYDFGGLSAKGKLKWGSSRYLAFVLRAREPNNLVMIDLGEAEVIDHLIAVFRKHVTGEKNGRSITNRSDNGAIDTSSNPGIALRAAVFDPIVPYLNDLTHLLLAPDGELTRLPFEALPLTDGYLIDTYHLSYLSVGRDVLRFVYESMHKPSHAVVIADPDFDLATEGTLIRTVNASSRSINGCAANKPTDRYSRDLFNAFQAIKRLPDTAAEGESIAEMLKVSSWLQQDALERPLKEIRSPYVLHLATHGFFLKNQQLNDSHRLSLGDFADRMYSRIATTGMENPLLRSGLVLAGVNTWLKEESLPEEAEDGVLTALDVSALDLTDTFLVVLSACDTGLGDVCIGEGVFGLRRAVMLAGAKTLVMSLWKVPDKATKELMINFYRRILKGESRAEALRNAQLAIKDKYPHPYYWGAFICQGDPGPVALRTRG